MSTESLKLHIRITKAGPHSFKATITAPNGEETIIFSSPLEKDELDATLGEFRRNIKNIRGELGEDTAQVLSSAALTPQELGNKLFKTVFSTYSAKRLYTENRAQSRNNRRPLQCVLEIDHRLNSLINLPWEYLYDEGRGVRGGFFAFDSLTPIIRRWQGEKPIPFETDPPLRVLVVSAQPIGDEKGLANLNREVKIIKKRLQILNSPEETKVRIDHLEAATLDELKEIIRDREKTPHIIHFIGHGEVGELFFEDRDGQRALVSEETLLITLKNAPSLRLVLLNACRTAASEALEGQLGVAQSLADTGIPAVIAMQFAISDDAAATFADEFYKVLAEGKPVEQAVTWGRIAIKDKLVDGAEWGTPVFYLQTEDGDIFNNLLQKGKTPVSSSPPTAQVETLIVSKTERKRRQEEEIARQIAHLQKLIKTYREQRRILQEQVAATGELHVASGKLLELQDLDKKIEDTEKELHALTDEEPLSEPLQESAPPRPPSAHETQAIKPTGNLDTGAIKQISPSIRHRVTQMFTEGITAFQKSNWGEAVKRLSNAQKLAPDLPDIGSKIEHARQQWQATEEGKRAYATLQVQYQGGMSKLKDKNWEEAAWLLEEVVKIDAGYQDAYDRALEARKNADTEKAEAEKREKLKALYTDALAQEGNKQWAAAVDSLTQIIELDEDYEDARNKLTEAIRQQDMAANYQEGLEAYQKKEWHKAAAAFSKVSANRKEDEYPDVEAYLSKSRHQRSLDDRLKEAEAYIENKNWDEAIKTLRETRVAEERLEGELALNYALAQQHYERGEWEKSAERFKNIIAKRADYRPDVEDKYAEASRQARLVRLYQEAVSAIEQSSWSEAKTRLEKIKKEDESYPELQEKLEQVNEELHLQAQYTRAQKEINARQWASAIPILRNICRIRPKYRDAEKLLEEAQEQVELNAIYNRGIDAMGELNWQEAYSAFQGIDKKNPNFRQTQEHLQNARSKIELTHSYQQGIQALEQGNTAHNLNKLAEALTYLEKASQIDPHYQGAENKYHRAKRAHKLLKLYLDGQAAFDRAFANKNEGNWEEAIAHWTKLVVEEGESDYHIDTSGSAAQKLKEAERQKRLRDLYQDAQKAMTAKDWAQAIALLKNLTGGEEGDPDYPQAADLLAEAELQQDLLTAFNQAQQAMKQEEWPLAIERLSYIQQSSRPRYRSQDVKELLKQAKENLELDTNYNKGMKAINANDWDGAVRYFNSVWNINSEYKDVEARRTQARTEQTLQRLYQAGENALQSREWTTAIENFARIQEKNPNYKETKQNLAEAHKQQGLEKEYTQALEHLNAHRWEEAIPILRGILEEENSYGNAQAQLKKAKEEIWLIETYSQAKEKVEQEDWAGAIELLEQIEQIRSNYENVSALLEDAQRQQKLRQLYDRATVLNQDGTKEQWPEALKLFEQILTIDEDYKDALSRKFDLEERIEQARLEQAYHQAEGILSADDESRWNEGIARLENLLAETPDYKPAQELLEKTRQRKAERFAALRQKANNAKNNQNWAEAIAALTRLTVMEPGDADLKQALKQAQTKQKQQKQRRLKYTLIGVGAAILLLSCLLGGIFTNGFWLLPGGEVTPAPTELATPSPTHTLIPPSPAPEIPELPPTEPDPTPAAPVNFEVSDVSTSSLSLAWTNPASAHTKVIIQLDGVTVEELPADAQSYTVANLECGSEFTLAILTANETAQSKPAQVVAKTAACPPPPVPTPDPVTNLQVGNATQTGVTLNWLNPTNNYTKILLQGSGINIELPAGTQSYTISNLQCGTSYNLTLLTVNRTGQSEPTTILAQTADCPSPPAPTPTLSGKIAVPVFDGAAYNVYIAQAGNNWQPTLFFGNGSQPAFSKDGNQLILRSWRSAEQGYGQRLVLFESLNPGATGKTMTQNLEDAHPSLRDGDNEIVFHTRRQGAPVIFTLGTWQGAGNSINNQVLVRDGENPDWLGRQIIYYAPGPPPGLYVGNNLILEEQGTLAPAAAPDGDRVAVSLKRGGHWRVFTLSASEGQSSLTQLTNEDADDMLPTWSPDGKFIAFVSNQGGKWAVWAVNADGRNRQHLFDLPGGGSIDGQVAIAPNMSFGWGEEKLSWAP